MNADVIDNGRTAIHTYLKRVKEGIRVDVHVIPEVEEFFQHWGGGAQTPITHNGRAWKAYPSPKDPAEAMAASQKILSWNMPQIRIDGVGFDLYNIGRSISQLSERGQNISFIRLVGASRGVSFLYENVVSRDELDQIAMRIQRATGQFYDQYIRDAHLDIQVITTVQRLE